MTLNKLFSGYNKSNGVKNEPNLKYFVLLKIFSRAHDIYVDIWHPGVIFHFILSSLHSVNDKESKYM